MPYTPTPWQISKDKRSIESVATEPCIDALSGKEGKSHTSIFFLGNTAQFPEKLANGVFIVKAVNCHEDLVKALQLAKERLQVMYAKESDVFKHIEQALRKAEE